MHMNIVVVASIFNVCLCGCVCVCGLNFYTQTQGFFTHAHTHTHTLHTLHTITLHYTTLHMHGVFIGEKMSAKNSPIQRLGPTVPPIEINGQWGTRR